MSMGTLVLDEIHVFDVVSMWLTDGKIWFAAQKADCPELCDTALQAVLYGRDGKEVARWRMPLRASTASKNGGTTTITQDIIFDAISSSGGTW